MLNKTVSTLALILFSMLLLNTTIASADERLGRALWKNLHVVAGPKININQITASTLSKHLNISLKDANTLVANRKGNGYKNARQLRTIKGLSKQTHDKLNKIQFAFGKGTKQATTSTSAKPELL